MTRILAIANQKGGVGKTTTSVNLAASLAQKGRRVLVVDMDPQANATSGLGMPRGAVQEGIYEALALDRPIRELTQLTEVPNLWLVPSTRELAGAEIELVGIERSRTTPRARARAGDRSLRLRRASTARRRWACSPSTRWSRRTAVVIPMQCEYYALEGLSQLVETIEQVRSAFNPVARAAKAIVLTMVDPRMNLTQQVADEVRAHFGDKVYNTIIPRNVRLSEAPSHGKPILLYDQRSTGSQSYLALARELLHRDRTPAAAVQAQ